MLRRIFGPNVEFFTSIGDDLSRVQAQHWINFDFKFDLEL